MHGDDFLKRIRNEINSQPITTPETKPNVAHEACPE